MMNYRNYRIILLFDKSETAHAEGFMIYPGGTCLRPPDLSPDFSSGSSETSFHPSNISDSGLFPYFTYNRLSRQLYARRSGTSKVYAKQSGTSKV